MLQRLPFGRTGHESSRIIFGAAALSGMRAPRAEALLDTILAAGINHIDTAASYGESELRLAPWLKSHRDEVFLATKTAERSYAGARDGIRRSLERLGVDHVDLIQFHNLVDEEERQRALGEGGALQAAVEARDEGLVRHIGVTGHGTYAPGAHLASLEAFDFDSVLFVYNYSMMQNPQYAADSAALLAHCRDRGVAIQTIKAVARRRWQDTDSKRFSWYEPIRDPEVLTRAVRWVLNTPDTFLTTTSDGTLVPAIIDAAQTTDDVPSDALMAADLSALGIEPLFVRDVSDSV